MTFPLKKMIFILENMVFLLDRKLKMIKKFNFSKKVPMILWTFMKNVIGISIYYFPIKNNKKKKKKKKNRKLHIYD